MKNPESYQYTLNKHAQMREYLRKQAIVKMMMELQTPDTTAKKKRRKKNKNVPATSAASQP
jgi:hypothetical protein